MNKPASRRPENIIGWIAILILSIVTSYNFWTTVDRFNAYHEISSITISPDVIERGGVLQIHVTARRNIPMNCAGNVERFIIMRDQGADRPDVIVYSAVVPAQMRNGENVAFNNVIAIPPYLDPGPYFLRFRANFDCATFHIASTNRAGDIPFTIIERRDQPK